MTEKKDFYEKQSYRKLIGANVSSRHYKVIEIAAKYNQKRQINRMLDIGCLDGTFSMLLGESISAKEIYGADISEENVKNAQGKGCKAVVFDMDSGKLPLADASFELIHAGDVIEHLYNPDNLLREIRRLLSDEGICIITTPNLAALANRIALLLGYQPFPVGTSLENDTGKLFISSPLLLGGHIRVFTCRAFVQLCRIHGFKVIKSIGMPLSSGGQQKRGVKIIGNMERSILAPTLYRAFPGLAWDSMYVLKIDTGRSK